MQLKLTEYQKVAVIGGGAWGTALAIKLAINVKEVTLYSKSIEVVNSINQNQINPRLNDIILPANINATSIEAINLKDYQLIIIAVPTHNIRKIFEKIAIQQQPIVICSKGIENDSLLLMSEVIRQYCTNEIAILSGPNFAKEIAVGKFAATTIACNNINTGKSIQKIFASKFFRTYLSDDILGVQIAAALKNVIAIAAGMVVGLNMGENAKIALITRGIAEIYRISIAKNAKPESIMGLAGIGDIMLTCSSKASRNMFFGYSIGRGVNIKKLLIEHNTVEGYKTTESAYFITKSLKIDTPIIKSVYYILYKDGNIASVIEKLLNRELKEEFY